MPQQFGMADIQRIIQGAGGMRNAPLVNANPGGTMNPVLAAAMGSYGPMNWQGAQQFAQAGNYSQMPVGQAMLMSGQQNFMPQMQGAYDQMGGIINDNAQRSRQVNDQNLQAQLLREQRHDSNQKFTSIFDALLKPKQSQVFNTRTNSYEQQDVSPLLDLLARFMPGGAGSSSSSSVTGSVTGRM